MPAKISSVDIPNGQILVSTDEQNPIANEITIYGSDLSEATSVEFDSGEDYAWVVSSMSANSNSIIVTAFAFGSGSGSGSLDTAVTLPLGTISARTDEISYDLPLLD